MLSSLQVKAGDKLTAEWHHTLDSTPETDKSDPVDPGHLGPIMVYLAKVDDALTTTVTGLKCAIIGRICESYC